MDSEKLVSVANSLRDMLYHFEYSDDEVVYIASLLAGSTVLAKEEETK